MKLSAWMLTVPVILLLGMASGWLSNSGYGNAWFDRLAKPSFMPPGWAFPVAWTTLYILMGVALGLVIETQSPLRNLAITLFAVQLVLNLAWSPVFFGMHQARVGLAIILILFVAAAATTVAFWRVQPTAALLMLPYLGWLLLASALNGAIVRLNLPNV
ncbi:TspO/MBR family protein [Sphingomonas crusticola]|uniref:TspO/MBR family protein n=1 Tax=Sphingomonas crusticola TaxID=1697973 RepID=UPI000E23281C|nr:TspO/MBR family protein [Sphingomonas crusticola]